MPTHNGVFSYENVAYMTWKFIGQFAALESLCVVSR